MAQIKKSENIPKTMQEKYKAIVEVKNLRQSRRLENVNRSKRVNLCAT